MTSSESPKVNDPFKVLLRIGVSIPIVIVIIVVWAYFIIHAASPLIKTTPTSASHTNINSWDIDKAFCNAQVTQINNDDSDGSESVVVQDDLQCNNGKIKYNCSDAATSSPTKDYCINDKELDNTKSWCGVTGLEPSQDDSFNLYDNKMRYYCCKDIDYEENINYLGLGLYLVITLPIIYLLIEKLLDKFIYRDQPFQKNIGNQFNWLGEYISKNGAKLAILTLVIYYLGLPLLRFFFVSYKCEGTTGTRGGNCGNPCDVNADCRNTHDARCTICINNICKEDSFSDISDTDAGRVNLKIGVCGINSILNDLQQEEINDIANQFGITNTVGGITNYITNGNTGSTTTAEEREKEITSYYYKFYPRQELIINDTSEPIRVRIPKPKITGDPIPGDPIPGFNYELNNYILLEENHEDLSINCNNLITDPNADNNTKKKICNDNFNCQFDGSNCVATTDCLNNRYLLPTIESLNDIQDVNSDLDLHNKVIRIGIDFNPDGSQGDNIYPCNDVVIPRVNKELALGTIQSNTPLNDDNMNTWINEFELKRIECADKMGQCYMDDYVCETKLGVPIPLKNLNHPVPNEYTIGELDNNGCSKSLYPCSDVEQPCVTLEMEGEYLVEKQDGGICKKVHWDNNNWVTADASTAASDIPIYNKCIPRDMVGQTIADTIPQAKVADWVRDEKLPTTSCKSVNRLTRSDIDNNPGVGGGSSINNYFRWHTDESSDTKFCNNQQCDGKILNYRATYPDGSDANTIQSLCCIDAPDTNSPLIVTTTASETPTDIGTIPAVRIGG